MRAAGLNSTSRRGIPTHPRAGGVPTYPSLLYSLCFFSAPITPSLPSLQSLISIPPLTPLNHPLPPSSPRSLHSPLSTLHTHTTHTSSDFKCFVNAQNNHSAPHCHTRSNVGFLREPQAPDDTVDVAWILKWLPGWCLNIAATFWLSSSLLSLVEEKPKREPMQIMGMRASSYLCSWLTGGAILAIPLSLAFAGIWWFVHTARFSSFPAVVRLLLVRMMVIVPPARTTSNPRVRSAAYHPVQRRIPCTLRTRLPTTAYTHDGECLVPNERALRSSPPCLSQ